MDTNIEAINRDQLERLITAMTNETLSLRHLLSEANAALEAERGKYQHLVRVHDQIVELYLECDRSVTA